LTTKTTIENAKINDKRNVAEVPLYISGMAKATNFKFGVQKNYED